MTLVFLLATYATALRVKAEVSPIEKVLQLLADLEAKIIKDGEAQQKLYEEFADYCKDTSVETQHEIKTAKADAERFSALIDESAAEVSTLETKIGELSTSVATNSADLAAATKIREKEAKDFVAADTDLMSTVDMLGRAIGIIEKEMRGGSFVQADSVTNVANALQTLVDAASVNSLDKTKVQALLQTDDFQPAGAPDPAAYENKSGGILSVLEDMLEKAEAQRADGQKAEMNAKHNFSMLKQSMDNAVGQSSKDLSAAKKDKAAAEERNAGASGDLERTQKEITQDQQKLKDLQHECMTRAEDFELEQHERGEELGALAAATKILKEKTGAAADRAYSFLQLGTRTKDDDTTTRVVSMLRSVAKASGASELVQMALRVRAAVGSGADPFGKVKGMIQEMIEKLVSEAQEEASKKAFCDKEMSETKAKREDKQGEVDDLNTKIDSAAAKIAKLTEGISTLEEELHAIAEEQKRADAQRAEEKDAWINAAGDFKQGLEGVRMALQVLRDYYAEKDEGAFLQSDITTQMAMTQTAHEKSSGGASGIIGMLEVAESDFAKMLADGSAAEDQAQKEYDTVSQDNEVTTASKRTEVTYKQKDLKETQAYLADTKEDLGTSDTELSAIVEYWTKLQPQCVAKPEPYEERKKRREAEIAGLKEALEILASESGSAFLQRRA